MPVLATNMGVVDGIGYSLLGFAIVFAALIALWGIIAVMAKAINKNGGEETAAAKESAPVMEAAAEAPAAAAEPAPGSAGELVLKKVSERDAAVIMAIVAHKLQKPLNELRFRSITEVEE